MSPELDDWIVAEYARGVDVAEIATWVGARLPSARARPPRTGVWAQAPGAGPV